LAAADRDSKLANQTDYSTLNDSDFPLGAAKKQKMKAIALLLVKLLPLRYSASTGAAWHSSSPDIRPVADMLLQENGLRPTSADFS
jgi:hypothetical protein